MTEHSSASIPKPKDWQDFERNIRVLFECLLNDITTKCNGRTGQPQNGVDVYGRMDGKGTEWYGIQCKGKNANYGQKVTETELRKEVKKALNFQPYISKFILVTTSPDDVKIDEVARIISNELANAGRQISVNVWGWDTLEDRISRNHKALLAFHPDATPFTEIILQRQEQSGAALETLATTMMQLQTQFSGFSALSQTDNRTFESELDPILQDEIDGYRESLSEGKPKTALKLLIKCKTRVWEKASNRVKFRISTNMGSAYYQLGEAKNAARCFLEAATYEPEDKIALANVALANLLLQNFEEAAAAAMHALTSDPDNAEAASFLIQSRISDLSVKNPTESVPTNLLEKEAVKVGLINFYRMRNDPRWVIEAQGAKQIDKKKHHYLERFCAESDLELSFGRYIADDSNTIDELPKPNIHNALEVLRSIWNKQITSEVLTYDSSLPLNLVQGYRFIGDEESALEILTVALNIMPANSELLKAQAAIHLTKKNIDGVLQVLKPNSLDPQVRLLRAEALLQKSPLDSLLELQNFEEIGTIETSQQVLAAHIRVDAYLADSSLTFEKKIELAKKQSEALIARWPEDIGSLLLHALVLEKNGDIAGERAALKAAKNLLVPYTPIHLRLSLANRFARIEDVESVIDILKDNVDTTYQNVGLQMLLSSYVTKDRRYEARTLLDSFDFDISQHPEILRVAIGLHVRRGDYEAVETTLRQLITAEPTDLLAHLNLTKVWLRRRDLSSIQAFLATNVEQLVGTPENKMELAKLLEYNGFIERALLLAYETHIKNATNETVQSDFISMMLQPNLSKQLDLHMETVQENCAFSIESENGEKETFVIENNVNLRIFEGAVSSIHPFAASAQGLKTGEKFSMDEEQWTITSISHKYLHLMQTKLKRFKRQFPDSNAVGTIKLREDENGNTSFDPLLDKVKQRHDQMHGILKNYSELGLPLRTYSQYLGGNTIEAWQGVIQTGTHFKVCNGTTSEKNVALKSLKENCKVGCVVDDLTLHIIRTLTIEDIVISVCGPISMTESSIDTFRNRRERILSQQGSVYSSLYWENNQFYMHEVSESQLEQALEGANSDLDWIDNFVEVIPAETEHTIPEDAILIRDTIDHTFLDSILAAQGANRLLLCEDQSYRMYAQTKFGIPASWLQMVLFFAFEHGIISVDRYSDCTCNLIRMGHNFTSVNAQVLISAMNKSEEQFDTACSVLFCASSDVISHSRVLAFFLKILYSLPKSPNVDQLRKISDLLRKALFAVSRTEIFSVCDFLETLKYIVRSNVFDDYLERWQLGHFIDTRT